MDPITRQAIAVAAGAGGGDPLYVDDVFSTFLYEASGTTQAINNGIDLAGEGGMVWIKNRANGSSFTNHTVVDSERIGSYGHKSVYPNLTEAEFNPTATSNAVVTSFSSNGFTRGGNGNVSNGTNVSWSFRKAPGFFDVVTYTGTGSVQNISHSLGSTPGMIMVKHLNGTSDWSVWHRSLSVSQRSQLRLNTTSAEITTNTDYWGNTAPTSTQFTVGNSLLTGGNGQTYVAYVFAHDDQSFGTDGDEAIIKCGSYTGNGSGNGPVVNLGFEPQFLLTKKTSGGDAGTWTVLDNMRGINADGNAARLYPNTSDSESDATVLSLTSTGFQLKTAGNSYNANGATYIYMAIRRPHKPPTAGTEVFAMDTGSSSSTIPTWDSGFTVDMAINHYPNSSGMNHVSAARLMGANNLVPNNTNALGSNGNLTWDSNVGWGTTYNYNAYSYMFRRAPGFVDVVAYKGNGANNHQIPHNLGVVPEFALFKERNSTDSWVQFNDMNASTSVSYTHLTLPTILRV